VRRGIAVRRRGKALDRPNPGRHALRSHEGMEMTIVRIVTIGWRMSVEIILDVRVRIPHVVRRIVIPFGKVAAAAQRLDDELLPHARSSSMQSTILTAALAMSCRVSRDRIAAYDYRMWTRLDIFDSEDAELEGSIGITTSVIGPGADMNLTVNKGPITDQDIATIFEGRQVVIFWGEMNYRDAFKIERFFRFHFRNGREMPSRGGWQIEATPSKPDQGN
jgi:hypothetical protein